ncbi:MAG: hypothetical protein HY691_11375 [Chloroflexi bacterium]|nr:hypothetical protein [Chloroflexota bacterium]
MTIAISLKVHDGLVLAADSATTLVGAGASGTPAVINVYNNANKVFNLYKGLPIGGMTWGAGSIGYASIATLAKDFRERLTYAKAGYEGWQLNRDSYTIEQVANLARHYLFEEQYQSILGAVSTNLKPSLGFLVTGYSAGSGLAEEWLIEIDSGQCPAPRLLQAADATGVSWFGQRDVLHRLLMGYSERLPGVLDGMGVSQQDLDPVMNTIQTALRADQAVVQPPMPIQDAIDLAAFLAETTAQFTRFAAGPNTVGGEIEVAAITKHEGFKWVRRKHYYDVRFNPPVAHSS